MVNPKAGLRPFKSRPWLGLRRIAPFQTEHNADGKRIRVFWIRLLAWITVSAVLSWMALTGAAYFYVKYGREYSEVQYRHLLLLPWKLDEYRRAKCEYLLAKGKRELDEGKYLAAFNNIRLGLLEVPQDTEARLSIVQFYIALKRMDLAEQTLAEGLPFNAEKREYVMTYFRYLFSQQWDDRAVEFSRKLQAQGIKDRDVLHALVMAEASAHYFRGRYSAAEAVIKDKIKSGVRDALLLLAQITWQRGDKEGALNLLSDLAEQRSGDPEIYALRVSMLREAGRISDVRSIAVLYQLEQPEDPAGFIDEVSTLDSEAEVVRWAGAVSEIFSRFPSSEAALNGLAAVAAAKGQTDLAWRIYKHCKAQNIPWQISATGVIEAHLAAKRFADAITAAQTIVTENEEWAKTNGTQFDAFRSIANYGLGDKSLSELQLQNYLNDKEANAANFFAVAEQMARVGALDQARTILAAAVKANPLDQASLTRLVELDLEQLDTLSLVTNTDRLLVMRKPEPAFLRKIQSTLQSDRYIFEGSDALLKKISARLAQKEEG
jgi:hypothetical protein